MDNLERFINKYRTLRAFNKAKPFLINAVYIAGLIIYIKCENEAVLQWVDLWCNVSPFVMILILCESYIIGLCKYHKIACLIPMLYFLTVACHMYVYNLTAFKYDTHVLLAVSSLLIIITGLKVLFSKD